MSPVTCDMSHVTCHVSHVTCHLQPVTNANSPRPTPNQLTPPLSCNFDVLLDLESLEPNQPTLFYEKKKNKNSDHLAIIDNYRHKHRQTDMATL